MAATYKQPCRHLLHLTLYVFLLASLASFSYSQSDSPQNIETFYPSETLSPSPAPATITSSPPPIELPPVPPPPSPRKSSSDTGSITKAVLITASGTIVLAAAFFFLLQKCVIARRRRDRVGDDNNFVPPGGGGVGGPRPVLVREEFTRFGGNVKGLIVDENGLDVLYCRKLERDKSGSFLKDVVDRAKYEEEEEKKVIYYKNKRERESIQELPLLRGKSSSSHSQIHEDVHDIYRNATKPRPPVKITTFNPIENAKAKSQPSNTSPPLPPSQQQPPPPPPAAAAQNKATSAPPPIPTKLGPPPPPPIPAKQGPVPPPPPPPKIAAASNSSSSKPPPMPKGSASVEASTAGNGNNCQVKLKPLHWDKVNPDSDHSMVWDKIDRGSFRFDGDLMEALFGYVATSKNSPTGNGNKTPSLSSSLRIFILDPRKSQNTAIMLKSLAISREELLAALLEGHALTADTLERLARIAPTQEEQTAILEFNGDPKNLADAESFLFHLLKAVPSAFARLNALLFKSNYHPEIAHHKERLQTLDLACKELRSRGLFVKLLEAILKAGNRMNAGTARGNAQAFNLAALRKLSDVKSVDGKTTLLHFVVEEVVRYEGKRCVMNRDRSLSRSNSNGGSSSENSGPSKEAREKEYVKLGLPIVGGLSSEFSSVKKAAGMDYDAFAATCTALSARAKDTRRVLMQCDRNGEDGFGKKMKGFLDSAEEELRVVREEQARVMEFVKRTTEYYQAGIFKDKKSLQLFVIIKDFLGMVDLVCVEIARNLQKKKAGTSDSPTVRNGVKFPVLPPNFMLEKRSD